MQTVKASIADENGELLLRDIDVLLFDVPHPNYRSWHGQFSLPSGSRHLDILGRYNLLFADGSTVEFLLERVAPNLSLRRTDYQLVVDGDISNLFGF